MTGLSVNTNLGALTALRFYQANAAGLDGIRDRLSTGLRVIGPRDDAATFSIAQGIRGDIKAWQAVDVGLGAAHGVLTTTLNAATSISDIMGDLEQKVIEYFSADTARRAIVQADIDELIANIDVIANSATFGGVNLIASNQVSATAPQPADEGLTFTLSNSDSRIHVLGAYTGFLRLDFTRIGGTGGGNLRLIYDGTVVDSETFNPGNPSGSLSFSYPASPSTSITVDLQGSPNPLIEYVFFLDTDPIAATGEYRVLSDIGGAMIDAQFRSMLSAELGLSPFSLTSSDTALTAIEGARRQVNRSLGYFAAKLHEVSYAREAAARFSGALAEGLGSLVDADLHRESALLAAARVREQLSLEALAVVNNRPQIVLGLFEASPPEREPTNLP